MCCAQRNTTRIPTRLQIELIVAYATDEVREIAGVNCRVVVDVVVEPEWDEDEGKWGLPYRG